MCGYSAGVAALTLKPLTETQLPTPRAVNPKFQNAEPCTCTLNVLFFFFPLVAGPRRSVRLKLRDGRVCEPQIRALNRERERSVLTTY
jgi:hypothetical protein